MIVQKLPIWSGGSTRMTTAAIAFAAGCDSHVREVIHNAGLDAAPAIATRDWLRALEMPAGVVDTPSQQRFVETVRVAYGSNDVVYLLEFRADTHNWFHRYRRIYNLLIGTSQYCNVSIQDAREHLFYVIVRESESCREIGDMTASMNNLVNDEPWEYTVDDIRSARIRRDERLLSGVVCKKAYVIYENELRGFAKVKGLV